MPPDLLFHPDFISFTDYTIKADYYTKNTAFILEHSALTFPPLHAHRQAYSFSSFIMRQLPQSFGSVYIPSTKASNFLTKTTELSYSQKLYGAFIE